MSAEPVPIPAPKTNLGTSGLLSEASTLPIWDRLSTWAADNKVVVYTIAGVAVAVSGAGVAYYLSESRRGSRDAAEEKKRLSKKERRKAKQDKDKQQGQSDSRAPVDLPKDECKQASGTRAPMSCSSHTSKIPGTKGRSGSIGGDATGRRIDSRNVFRRGIVRHLRSCFCSLTSIRNAKNSPQN